ncbi:MAG: hypothetical protein QXL19_10000 [Ignisphaera sp.]
MVEETHLRILPRDIYVPAREVVKQSRDRWIIYLPRDFNAVWEEIKRRGLKVRIYIQVVEGKQG